MPSDPAEIDKYRVKVEARVRVLLQEARGETTLDDIKVFVFYRDHDTPPRIWLYEMAELFGQGPDPVAMSNAELMVLQDAWNYFPHRSLNGRSPAEVFLALS